MGKQFFTSYPKPFQLIFIGIMLAMLFAPLFAMRFHVRPFMQTQENRELAKKPTFTMAQWDIFPTQFEQYFNDNFGLRTDLVYLNAVGKVRMHTSPSEQVALGKNNWLYYIDGLAYLDSINGEPFTKTEQQEIVKNLAAVQQYFDKRNITFYFIIAPNDKTIYPEYAPRSLAVVSPYSRLDQLTHLMAKEKTVAFIPVVPGLLHAKKQGQVYYKDDTHWNEAGAFIAYQALLNRMHADFPDLAPTQKSDYSVTWQYTNTKDLESLLGLEDYYNDKEPIFTPKTPTATRVVGPDCSLTYSAALCPNLVLENPNQTHTLLMFRDSFAVGLLPFLPQHFKRSVFDWTDTIDTAVVDREKPDIVVWEMTERNLFKLTAPLFNNP